MSVRGPPQLVLSQSLYAVAGRCLECPQPTARPVLVYAAANMLCCQMPSDPELFGTGSVPLPPTAWYPRLRPRRLQGRPHRHARALPLPEQACSPSPTTSGAASSAPTARMSPHASSPPSAKQILEALGQQGDTTKRLSFSPSFALPVAEKEAHGHPQDGIYLVALSPSEAATLNNQSRLLLQVSNPTRDNKALHRQGALPCRSAHTSGLGSLSDDPFMPAAEAYGVQSTHGAIVRDWSPSRSSSVAVSPLLLPRKSSFSPMPARSPSDVSSQHSLEEIQSILTSEARLGQHLRQSGLSSLQTAFMSWKFLFRR